MANNFERICMHYINYSSNIDESTLVNNHNNLSKLWREFNIDSNSFI